MIAITLIEDPYVFMNFDGFTPVMINDGFHARGYSKMTSQPTVVVRQLSHFFGEGNLRRQILFDINLEISSGEIVIMTGPSGSGKTTLLTLIGGLRQVQTGELQVLGQTLDGVSSERLKKIRRQIGFVFQDHNLLSSLNSVKNVEMAAALYPISRRESERRSKAALAAVGLEEHFEKSPNEMSGGQKQRVAIARALVNQPQIILADEPTASLDGDTGREVVDLMQKLAKQQGCTIILVTHDNRILDIADRIINLEDGRLATDQGQFVFSLSDLTSLVSDVSPNVISEMILPLSTEQFSDFLGNLNEELKETLAAKTLLRDRSFEAKLQMMLQAISLKIAQILRAEQVTFFVVDKQRQVLWSKNARGKDGEPTNIEVPMDVGIAGYVAKTGKTVGVNNPYGDLRFNPQADFDTDWVTETILCLPLMDDNNQIFAVAQALNKFGGEGFDRSDEERFFRLTQSLGYTVQSCVLDAQRLHALSIPSMMKGDTHDDRIRLKKVRSKVVALSMDQFAVFLGDLNHRIKKIIDRGLSLEHSFIRKKAGELLSIILCKFGQSLEVEWTGLFVVAPDGRSLRIDVSDQPWLGDLSIVELESSRGIAGSVVATGESVLSNAPGRDPRFELQGDVYSNLRFRNVLAVPIMDHGRGTVRTVLQLVNRLDGNDFSDHDHDLILALMETLDRELRQSIDLIGMGFFGNAWR